MPKMPTLDSIMGAPSSKENMRLSIQVHADSFINIGFKPMPVFYGTLERPIVIRATVTLETDVECIGNIVEINYKAQASYRAPIRTCYTVYVDSDQFMERRRWNTDLKHPKEGRVAAGKYSRLVGSTIDPLWPSSARTTQHNEGYGWVKYSFEATFSKYTMGALAPILTDTQEVWVLNSALLPDTQLRIERPFVNQNTWDGMKSKSSPLKLTLPSSTLMMGQVVPVTVRMSELKFKSKYVGQLPVVLAAYFALKQNVVGRATAHSIIWKYSEDVMTLPMKDGWPRSTDGWERTVHLTMPTSPDVAADTKSKFMDISHSLKLVMKIKAERQNDLQAKEYLTKVDVQILVPRYTPGGSEDVLPVYSLSSEGISGSPACERV